MQHSCGFCCSLDSQPVRKVILMRQSKTLLLFGFHRLSHMLSKGNVWYVRHYERYFDDVHVLYMLGSEPAEVVQGRSRLISLGSAYRFLDLLFAPFNLYRHARKVAKPSFLTADMVFGAWETLLVRRLLGARVVMMPVCILPELYAYAGKSLSGLPIWMEKFFVSWSFRISEKVIMGRNSLASLSWLRSDPRTSSKLQEVACTVEEFPPQTFFDALNKVAQKRQLGGIPTLLYVGRIHHEKMVAGLIDMMAILKENQINARLLMVGDGAERAKLEEKAQELGLASMIEWAGYVASDQLPSVYGRADIFISTNTGTALREAGLACLPIVGYNIDWVRQLLAHGETAMLCEPGDAAGLANNVMLLLRDDELREKIAEAFHHLARGRWAPEKIDLALRETFDDLQEA